MTLYGRAMAYGRAYDPVGVPWSCIVGKGQLAEYSGKQSIEKNTMVHMGKIHACLILWSFVKR